MTPTRLTAIVILLAACAGCGDTALPDASSTMDLSGGPPDLPTEADLAQLPDLTTLSDLEPPPDLTVLADLTVPPDLTVLPDLTPGRCNGNGDCAGKGVCEKDAGTCVECVIDADCGGGMRACCNSACVDLATSASHCGACGKACGAGTTCCAAACVDLMADVKSCGACGKACPTPAHAVAACSKGACGIGACVMPFADCNAMAADGCEVDTTNDVANCGGCAKACPAPANATAACAGSTCGIGMCNGTFKDCKNGAADGCETNSATDVNNCGGCGKACMVANGVAGCANSACTIASCNVGFGDCKNGAADGCETNTTNDVSNCGGCAKACAIANGSAVCVNSVCGVGMCNAGFKDCKNGAADGCETSVNADLNNCGACANVCKVPANGTAGCAAGVCGIAACNVGFKDCKNGAADGCETNTTNDVANCGGCGMACAVANGVAGCANSACTIASCNAGFKDCKNGAADGCETNVNTDANNCGACGNVCASGVCGAGKCLLAFSGVQTNLPVANVTNGGWSQCYVDTYNVVLPFATITAVNCTKARLMMACRGTGAATLDAAAWAPRADVLFPIGALAGNVTPHVANGVGWYADAGWSWGFAPAGDVITHFTCDTVTNVDSGSRICWDTSGAAGGFRCGAATKLNNSAAYERLVYQAD